MYVQQIVVMVSVSVNVKKVEENVFSVATWININILTHTAATKVTDFTIKDDPAWKCLTESGVKRINIIRKQFVQIRNHFKHRLICMPCI